MLKINRHSSYTLWIGLNDIGTEASYKWSDGSPVAYTNYNYREPNDWIGVEDCLEMYRLNGKWNDLHCSMLRPYICKKTNSKCASFCFFVCLFVFSNHYYSKIRLSLIVRVNVVLCGSHLQSHTLKMTTAQVVETSVTVNNNSPIKDYIHKAQPTFKNLTCKSYKLKMLKCQID